MNLADKKETLLKIVQDADDRLTGLLMAVAKEYNSTGETYSSEEIEKFYQIRNDVLRDQGSTYSPVQAHDLIRKKGRNEL
jgi:hypothetical protein